MEELSSSGWYHETTGTTAGTTAGTTTGTTDAVNKETSLRSF